MDFSKLSSNDKLAVYGAVAAIIGAFLSFGGAGSFGILTSIAMLVIIFLPQLSPSTTLPGSKGSLMMIVGGVSALSAVLALFALLSVFSAIGGLYGGTWIIGLVLSVAGGLLMGWASWQTFQAEGGKFNIGMASGPAAPTPPPAPPATPPPPAPPMAEPMRDPMADQGSSDEERQG